MEVHAPRKYCGCHAHHWDNDQCEGIEGLPLSFAIRRLTWEDEAPWYSRSPRLMLTEILVTSGWRLQLSLAWGIPYTTVKYNIFPNLLCLIITNTIPAWSYLSHQRQGVLYSTTCIASKRHYLRPWPITNITQACNLVEGWHQRKYDVNDATRACHLYHL